jgi:MFS family permease
VAAFAAAPTVAVLVPLSVAGGAGNGLAGVCLSTLFMTRTPDSARGRVSAAAGAVFGGAQGTSLLLGGAVAIVLSPREIYALAGLLGLAAAGLLAVASLSRASGRAAAVDAPAG